MRILGTVASSSREVPNAPTIGTATNVGSGRAYNNGRADVTFTAPTFNGGLPITSYTVTSSPGGFTGTGASSPITVTGLQSSTSYTFTVTATNARGTGPASAASNSITATTVPQAPTIGTAADGGTGTTATVTYTAGATGGAAVSAYTATSSPGSLTGTGASPITVSGLTTGTAYTFTVTATNANGTSTASAASNSVTPASPSSFESIATITPSGTNTITFSSIPSGYKSLQIRGLCTDGNYNQISMRFNGVTSSVYASHSLRGTGSVAQASGSTTWNQMFVAGVSGGFGTTLGAFIIDVIDYTSTTKNKTVRSFNGYDENGNGQVDLDSGLWMSTSAVTSITLFTTGNYLSGSTFALYGIK
jgi:hypothetical protein